MFSHTSRASLTLLTAALYGGPVLAGLAGHGWAGLPVFVALFLLYAAAARKPDLATPAGWAGLALMAAVQSVLVVLAWALGQALAGVFGAVDLPLWAPLALSGLAAGIGAWALRDAAEMDVMLDSVLVALKTADPALLDATGERWPDPAPAAAAEVQRVVERLRDASPVGGEIDAIVAGLEEQYGLAAFDAFYDAAGEGARGAGASDPAVDLGLLRFAGRRDMLEGLIARGEGGLAPMLLLASPHKAVRAEARARVRDLVAAGAPGDQLPDPAWLADLAATFPGEGFATLLTAPAER